MGRNVVDEIWGRRFVARGSFPIYDAWHCLDQDSDPKTPRTRCGRVFERWQTTTAVTDLREVAGVPYYASREHVCVPCRHQSNLRFPDPMPAEQRFPWTIWYHASPTKNRALIETRGLLGARRPGDGTETVFAIAGQPRALYLAPTLAEAQAYVEHVFERWFPDALHNVFYANQYLERGARLGSFDLWSIEVRDEALSPDLDWPGTAFWTAANFGSARLQRLKTITLMDRHV
jgi:hypothetical protein